MSTDLPSPSEELRQIEGLAVDVFVSPSLDANTQTIGRRCEHANQFFVQIFEFTPTFDVLILASEDWSAYTTHPVYGMPHISISRDRIVVAGEANDMWWASASLLKENAVNVEDTISVYGPQMDLSPFFDLLVVHELAHIFHWQAGVVFPRSWLKEVFVNLCLHAYIAAMEPDKLPILEAFPRDITSLNGGDLEHRSLEAFERNYRSIPALNYVWYQCHFQVAAKNIFEAGGIPALQRFWKTFAGPLAEWEDSELMSLLDENGLYEVKNFAENF
jgi:hypothetical protein